jgi:hypothetical protein
MLDDVATYLFIAPLAASLVLAAVAVRWLLRRQPVTAVHMVRVHRRRR